MLNNLEGYYVFKNLVTNGSLTIHTKDITKENWNKYYTGCLNLLKDGIELPEISTKFVTVDFGDNDVVSLSIFDVFFNIIMWHLPLYCDGIKGDALFFPNNMTQDAIKEYIDYYIIKMRSRYTSVQLNNIIDDTLHSFTDVDDFSMYLSNTINLKDTVDLARKIPEFNSLLYTSLEGVKIEDVKNEGMKKADRSIEIIENSKHVLGYDHCLANSFKTGEGINPRQYKEFAIHIGSKPNGTGGVNPHIIDKSYLRGGLSTVADQYVDSASSRVAQIQTKKNVKSSGNFARILGINNMDSFLCEDLDFKCDTHNFQVITIKNEKYLHMLIDRYYRLDPEGLDYKIGPKDNFLIGKQILLFSPITCASAAAGHGICRRCYGDLAYNNHNICVGKYAAEQLTSQLTQKQLSAKHLLETIVEPYVWYPPFDLYFEVSTNTIVPRADAPEAYVLISPDSIYSERDEEIDDDEDDGLTMSDYDDLNEYITEFTLVDSNGPHTIKNEQEGEMYFTKEFLEYMKTDAEYSDDDEAYKISLQDIVHKDIGLFSVRIINNDIDKGLKEIEHIINRKSNMMSIDYNKDALLESLIDTCIDIKLHIQSVHLEVICMNQIRSSHSILNNPDWSIPDQTYQILTLDGAIKNSPSIVNSLIYQKLGEALTYPLSYKKTAKSRMDLLFMKQPQVFMNNNIVEKPKNEKIKLFYTTNEARKEMDENK